MDKQTKVKVVAEVSEMTEQAKAIVLTGFTGLSVEAETQLRRDVRAVAGKYRVVRNTLAKLVMADEKWDDIKSELSGNTAIAFSDEDVVGLMKALVDFSKANKGLTIKCGMLDGKVLSADEVKVLATLPSREVLLARLLGALQSPLTGFMNVLTGSVRNLAQVLKAVADKNPEEGVA